MSVKSENKMTLLNFNSIVVSTHFLELFLLSVRGENSAALMTLVLDDVLRKLCLLFSSIPLFTSSFSSILPGLIYIPRQNVRPNGEKQLTAHKKTHPDMHKERRPITSKSFPHRMFEYGGLLEIDQSGETLEAVRCDVTLGEGPYRF